MSNTGDIFNAFCRYVDERIFSKENMGSYVALVVDQSFVDDFCRENHTTEDALIASVRRTMCRYFTYDHLLVKGLVAIQLLAASKRADSDNMTAQAYYGRLHQVIGWDEHDLYVWMTERQDDIWSTLYEWCDKNHFLITKCHPRYGKGRYVQYPIDQALRVFTEEDMLYIAKSFVDKHLYPNEDVTQYDFWKIVDKRHFTLTNHAAIVIAKSVSEDDYLSQIYNFYLRWNGKYKFREKVEKTDPALAEVFAYLTDDLNTIELRNEHLRLLYSFSTDQASYVNIKIHFPFKREGILLFKRDDVYENRWQEVRYIDADETDYSKESGNYGIVVCFRNAVPLKLEYKLKRCEVLFENKYIVIYKLIRRISTEEFFTEKRPYELCGGLKIGRNTYLKGATPILRLLKPSMVWIDGKVVDARSIDGDYKLNHIEAGSHIIKVIESVNFNSYKIKLEVVDSSANIWEWQNSYNKWQIGKKPVLWNNTQLESGIVGLDFSSVCDKETYLNESVTKRWARALVFDEYHPNENNIAINLTRS